MNSNLISFHDLSMAEVFYDVLQHATAEYSAGYNNLSRSGPTKFPFFMAAYVILAADPTYKVPREALSEFRQRSSLGALPEISWIIPNIEPENFYLPWDMSSIGKCLLF